MKHLDHPDVFQLCLWRYQDKPETTAHDSVSTSVSMTALNMFDKTFSVSANKTGTSMKPLDVFKGTWGKFSNFFRHETAENLWGDIRTIYLLFFTVTKWFLCLNQTGPWAQRHNRELNVRHTKFYHDNILISWLDKKLTQFLAALTLWQDQRELFSWYLLTGT